MSVITCEKSTSKIGEKLLIFFTFFIEFFLKILIKSKEHNLLPGCFPGTFLLMYVVKIVCEASLLSFLTWISLAIFCLDQWLMDTDCCAQHQLSFVWDNSLVCVRTSSDGSYPAICICNILYPTSCTKISLWKKPISNKW